MKLLNVHTLIVDDFPGRVPPYAILSHTWGAEEVTFKDMQGPRDKAEKKAGFAKVLGCCERARDDDFDWCWIDTCCIDKSSSADLSEAINSMYAWYKDALVCYVYLKGIGTASDVIDQIGNKTRAPKEVLSPCSWFFRGWTLQELIAPVSVVFYAEDWTEIGTRAQWRDELSGITGIPLRILDCGDLDECTIAQRLSWASRRETTRVEDGAYCLLGILEVHMPLLYGEGKTAFIRLQEEVLKTKQDFTLLAWHTPWRSRQWHPSSALAHSTMLFPDEESEFRRGRRLFPARRILPYKNLVNHYYQGHRETSDSTVWIAPKLTSRGLHLSLPMLDYNATRGNVRVEGRSREVLVYLHCRIEGEEHKMEGGGHICMRLQVLSGDKQYMRLDETKTETYHFLHEEEIFQFRMTELLLVHSPDSTAYTNVERPRGYVQAVLKAQVRLNAGPHVGLRAIQAIGRVFAYLYDSDGDSDCDSDCEIEFSPLDYTVNFEEGRAVAFDSLYDNPIHQGKEFRWSLDILTQEGRKLPQTADLISFTPIGGHRGRDSDEFIIYRLTFLEGSSVLIVHGSDFCVIIRSWDIDPSRAKIDDLLEDFKHTENMEGCNWIRTVLRSYNLSLEHPIDRAQAMLPNNAGKIEVALRRTGSGLRVDIQLK